MKMEDPIPVIRGNVDVVANAAKIDINTILPATAVVIEMTMTTTSPPRVAVVLDALGSAVEAEVLLATITDRLRLAGRIFTTNPRRRRDDGNMLNKIIVIFADPVTYHITNFDEPEVT